jgi:hypothetical protein
MRLAFLCLLLAGCAAPRAAIEPPQEKPAPLASVRPIDKAAAAACDYVDDVAGVSGWYGMFAEQGLANARALALEKASAAGANAIVWGEHTLRYGSTSIAGKAYRCPRS